ncbi:MAG: site-specific DNA-methyltransferase [bacterium]
MQKYNRFSKEDLIKLIEKQEQELKAKKYGLVWDSEKEPEKVVLDCENNLPILKRIAEKEIRTDESDDNILIEGDNYHALTCLNYTHKGKIDVIYIDPPYNTGNNSWKYNNDYVEKDDAYLHSKWLNMMSKRLEIAKNLLNDNGVLICAIDENELANLYILLYKLFCNQNKKNSPYCIDIISVMHNPRGIQGDNFSYCNEYLIFIYPNNGKQYIANKSRDSYLRNLRDNGGESTRNEGKTFYPFLCKNNKIIGFGEVPDMDFHPKSSNIEKKDGTIEIWPIDNNDIERKWRYSRNSIEEIRDKIVIKKSGKFLQVFINKDSEKYKTLWIDPLYDANEYGSKLLNKIISVDFPYPKSLYAVKECIIATCKNNKKAIILDFFAGSGTTGHAVLEINKEDNGKRKFILCTNNEGNICEEITHPRIRNIIKGYDFKGKDKKILYEKKLTFANLTKDFDETLEELNNVIEKNKKNYDEIKKELEDNTIKITGIKNIDSFKDGLGGNLQYFKTDLIPVERIDKIGDKQRHELTEKAGQMIAIKENTFEELELNKWYQIFENKNKTRKTAIYFRENADKFEELVNKIKNNKTVLYIFSYGVLDKKLFKYLGKNIIVEDIPEPIIDIYKEINQTLKDK